MRRMITICALITAFSLYAAGSALSADRIQKAAAGPLPQERTYDFGFLGIDFVVQHLYYLVNRTDRPLRILGARPSCQCTSVLTLDSLVQPGDTAHFRVKLDTKDLYGPVNKSFTVETDHPDLDGIEYYLTSVVGQWVDGLKPHPVSLFFLPAHSSKELVIANPRFAEIRLGRMEQHDDAFGVTVVSDRAEMGQALKLEIAPRSGLKPGTYNSNFTLTIEKKDYKKPTILTIPVKIVRY
ncbi:MAG: DUF1573 domain-containing protein [Candidatus Zixiibacteriota bacterium]